jgi:acetate kinase
VRVLVLNAGSSSLKHALVDTRTGGVSGRGVERWSPGEPPERHAASVRRALGGLEQPPEAIGHRVVHGGARFSEPALVDDDVRGAIMALAALAPLHNPAAVEGMAAAAEAFPGVPQVACFDTAFHRAMPVEARTYAVPRAWREEHGLERFGFHGLNVAWCAERAPAMAGLGADARIVVCHLGAGCSVTAVAGGRSVDTTMGLTPLEGVPMATRSGSLDPNVVLLLLERGVAIDELADGLEHGSGLLGLSERSGDLRELLPARDAGDDRARLALDVFVRGVAQAAAAMSASLGGLDGLVFTGGIGEHAPAVREAIAARLAHLGVALDAERNAAGRPGRIDRGGAGVRTVIVPANEELVIARQAAAVVEGQAAGSSEGGSGAP